MSAPKKIVLALVVLSVLGAAGVLAVRNSRETAAEVRTEIVGSRDLVSTITATGNVRPRRQVNISSDVQGRVVELNVDEGDEVERGQILLRIDPTQSEAVVSRAQATLAQAEAQVSQARTNLAQARRELDRLEGILARDPNLVSRQALEDAQSRVDLQTATLSSVEFGVAQARAGLEEALELRARTTIAAPISGRVTRLNIETGETVVIGTMNNPGSLLLTISDLSAIEAVLRVDETDLPLIALGDSAVVELDAFPGQGFAASVVKIGNSAIQASSGARTSVDFEVILTLLDPPASLRPDLSATADIIVERRVQALSVPIIAVTVRDDTTAVAPGAGAATDGTAGGTTGGTAPAQAPGLTRPSVRSGGSVSSSGVPRREGVFVVRDGKAVWTPITIGITGQDYFEVLSGLAPGDEVISGPFQRIQTLKDGDPVRVSNVGGETPAPAR
jgi:HlyD family secretion protein